MSSIPVFLTADELLELRVLLNVQLAPGISMGARNSVLDEKLSNAQRALQDYPL